MRMLEGFRFGVRQGNPHRARCRLRGRLRRSPGVPATSAPESTADENPKKRISRLEGSPERGFSLRLCLSLSKALTIIVNNFVIDKYLCRG